MDGIKIPLPNDVEALLRVLAQRDCGPVLSPLAKEMGVHDDELPDLIYAVYLRVHVGGVPDEQTRTVIHDFIAEYVELRNHTGTPELALAALIPTPAILINGF